MKTYKHMGITVAALMAILCSWLSFTAFSPYNPCEFANNNIQFIKEQTEQAIIAPDLKMSKYYAYKALNGIWNAEYSFTECGCADATSNMELAYDNLKEATKAQTLEDSKVFLQIAIKNTRNSINAIKEFKTTRSKYGTLELTVNTKESEPESKNSLEKPIFLEERMENHLKKYQNSIDNVLKINDCERAHKFIVDTQKKTESALMNTTLSERKRYYHKRVLQITKKALQELEACSGESLLAGK